MSKNTVFQIGDTVSYEFCPVSRVVGVDRYTLKAFDGQTRQWESYTLVSDAKEAGLYARWWIVNVPGHGAHAYVGADAVPPGCVFDPVLSGLVALDSEGNADLSSEKGALAVYSASKGGFYAEEVFDEAERLVFYGTPLSP